MATTVHDNAERSRYEIEVDGTPAGFAEYRLTGGRLAVTHTEIDPAFGGQGLGTRLIESVVRSAQDAGLAVLPYCWFVRDFIAAHPEHLALVPPEDRAQFRLPADPAG